MLRLVFGNYLRESIPVNTVQTSRPKRNNRWSRIDKWCLLVKKHHGLFKTQQNTSLSDLPCWQCSSITLTTPHFFVTTLFLVPNITSGFCQIPPLHGFSFSTTKDHGHLGLILRAGPLIVAAFATLWAKVRPLVPVFNFAADALRLWSSRETLDEWREQSHGLNWLDVDRNDPHFIDSPQRPDSSLVDA